MIKNSARRWLAGLGVAGAFVAASATPAFAEEPEITLGWYFSDTTVAAGTPGKVEAGVISASASTVLHEFTVRYDYTDLVGTVDVTAFEDTFDECSSPSKGLLVCTSMWEEIVEEWGLGGLFPVQITPTKTAKDGDSGTLKTTVSAAGIDAVSTESTVRVGEGVDLAAGPQSSFSLNPGKSYTAPLKVSNVGDSVAKGAVAVFFNDYGMNAAKRFSNCTYVGDILRACHFDGDLAGHSSFSTSLPYVLGSDTFAPGLVYGEILWLTPAEFEDFAGYVKRQGMNFGEPGTDGELSLTEAGGDKVSTQGFQADTQPDNNWSSVEVKVTGKNSTDLEALGDKVGGKAGDTVKATVGVRNNGPATLDRNRAASSVTYLTLGVPKGTTAVEVPQTCMPENGDEWGEPGEPGAAHYRCFFGSFLKAGDTATLDFTLRIDKVIANATGTVKINVPCACDGGFYADLKPANDTTKLLVNATADGDGGQGGGDDGDGPTLPITGSSTGLIAGVGALLLVAGVGGYVLARRRKTRFVA
ncbi:LPXTG cell wall anchor domain-containing protein [Micromonospora globbae]|uniref:LPXTG cell wall anchor domain-containing protein n=1 Tax=Micromonospora globbae TaxID=1894969 RepID=A0A420F3B5_9ACTN|nr:LPXTG cell wall anchor domain-containing protein [Micromonospora globbae]RKF27417.1 LPXTG cell wall anchor domain-containing protein [Micromonospora globbae]